MNADDRERELTKSLESVHCPKCKVKGSLRVEKELNDTEEIQFVLICTVDDCDLREKGVRL